MYTWADEFATYSDACIAYGADTPERLAKEQAEEWKQYCNDLMHSMMAGVVQPGAYFDEPFDDMHRVKYRVTDIHIAALFEAWRDDICRIKGVIYHKNGLAMSVIIDD